MSNIREGAAGIGSTLPLASAGLARADPAGGIIRSVPQRGLTFP